MLCTSTDLQDFVRRAAFSIGATEAAVFAVEQGHADRLLLHVRPDDSNQQVRDAAVAAFREIVKPCVRDARDAAIEIERSQNPAGKQFCLVTLARRAQQIVGAAAFIVRCRDPQVATSLLRRLQ